ncbi:MAG: twin-arginine translocase TatA/TatE family subunit [Nitrospiraceae bacterium]|nr:twin-arginine translocase TatA/TatE family subunit [Nitrospiraceae bacterium]
MFEGLFQPLHLIVILAIVLIIFGPGKLPDIGAGLGKSIREFKKAMSDADKDIDVTPQRKESTEKISSPASMEAQQQTEQKESLRNN